MTDVLLVVLGVALLGCVAGLAAQATLLARGRRKIQRLEAELAEARTPAKPLSTAERAVRKVVGTAATVRDQGVRHGMRGLLMSSIDDLTRWALEDRPEIAKVASSDGTLTIFFSDIEGSTALNHDLGDKAWVRVLASHEALIRAFVEQQHGHIVKSQGDGFMIVFREAGQAVRSGLSIQHALATGRNRRLRRTSVRVRIGIHTGTVITRDGDYFGSAVAMAARVGALADGGEILVSAAVREALGDDRRFALEETEQVELKGLPGSHVLWRVKPGR
jgi:adenylate cyclase